MVDHTQHKILLKGWDNDSLTAVFTVDSGEPQKITFLPGATLDVMIANIRDTASQYLLEHPATADLTSLVGTEL